MFHAKAAAYAGAWHFKAVGQLAVVGKYYPGSQNGQAVFNVCTVKLVPRNFACIITWCFHFPYIKFIVPGTRSPGDTAW